MNLKEPEGSIRIHFGNHFGIHFWIHCGIHYGIHYGINFRMVIERSQVQIRPRAERVLFSVTVLISYQPSVSLEPGSFKGNFFSKDKISDSKAGSPSKFKGQNLMTRKKACNLITIKYVGFDRHTLGYYPLDHYT